MFTGIVENMGSVVRLTRSGGGARLQVRAPGVARELGIGDSVAVNGACVTVVDRNDEAFAADLVPETVARTNLGILQPDEEVNLEMPMRAGDRFGGHIVQGHVDAVGVVRSRRKVGAQWVMEVTIPFELTRYLAAQGSVALDGVSLTVVAVDKERFRVALIPHTFDHTTLGRKEQGASVNVEVDVLSKYVERHLSARASRPVLLAEEPRPEPAGAPARLGAAAAARPALAVKAPAKAAAVKAPAKPAKVAPKSAAVKPPRKPAARASSNSVGRAPSKAARPARVVRPKAGAAKRPVRATARAKRPARKR